MPVAHDTSRSAPICCERCGSILSIFEEHPDGAVIFCVCRCMTESAPKEHARPPASPARPALGNETAAARVPGHCGSCGATLVLVGTRPDGSPIEAECHCQGVGRASDESNRKSHESPIKIQRGEGSHPYTVAVFPPAAIPEESRGRGLIVLGAGAIVVAALLAGLWTRSNRDDRVPPTPAKPIARSDVAAAPDDKAPPSLPPGGIEIVNDPSGVATLVSGTDPGAVFRTFCRLPQFKSALVPGALQSTTPPDPDLLVGHAVLMDGTGTTHQVLLKRSGQTNRWSIGNGKNAISIGNPAADPSAAEGSVR